MDIYITNNIALYYSTAYNKSIRKQKTQWTIKRHPFHTTLGPS